jgi:hypothetical protein
MNEALEIGRRTGARVEISHLIVASEGRAMIGLGPGVD